MSFPIFLHVCVYVCDGNGEENEQANGGLKQNKKNQPMHFDFSMNERGEGGI